MKVVIQRVSESSVKVDGTIVGEIGKGLMLLVGIDENDEKTDADWLVQKILNLRIFGDEDDKLNLSVQDIKGEILCISQFTLIADYKKETVLLSLKQQNRIKPFLFLIILKNRSQNPDSKQKAEFSEQT
jgi:D-tyrosyl-tRNA(Tyr) deacylase